MKHLKPLTFFLFISFLLFTGMQCKKDETNKEEVLPAETQTGKGTFGCLVNGVIWIPKGNFPYAGLTTSIQFEGLNLMTNKSTTNEGINFGISNLIKEGEYELNNQNVTYILGATFYKSVAGKLTITKYDKVNQIISGRFWFTAKNSSGEVVEITEGRFDVKFTI